MTTCTVEMSATASTGSFVALYTPRPAIARTASSTSQRCSMQKRMMRSNIAASVGVLGAALAHFGLQHERVGGGDLLARLQAAQDFDRAAVGSPGPDRHGLEAAGHGAEHHRLVLDVLQGL